MRSISASLMAGMTGATVTVVGTLAAAARPDRAGLPAAEFAASDFTIFVFPGPESPSRRQAEGLGAVAKL
jgi:hypothetical protein